MRVSSKPMAYVSTMVAGFLFGAVDQYLGSGHVTSRFGYWTITVSGMSAPWLILPFVAGLTQERARKAAILGLIVSMSALLGYFWMSNSAFEGVPLEHTLPRMFTMATTDSNLLWIAGGLFSGPLYGYFGHRWRVARSWVAAALVSLALCLEPLARRLIGEHLFGGLNGSPVVWGAEIALGVATVAVLGAMILTDRRTRHRTPSAAG